MRKISVLKQIFKDHPGSWDHDDVRPDLRSAIRRMLACGTGELGKATYASLSGEELDIPYTCKGPACSSCAQRTILDWQLGLLSEFPNIPYAGVMFTMPSALWLIFKENRHLVYELSSFAANTLQEWADRQHGARVQIFTVTHTFGASLNFNPHVHLVVSSVGLDRSGNELVWNVRWCSKAIEDALARLWRDSIVNYLLHALDLGQISTTKSQSELRELLEYHRDLWFKVGARQISSLDAVTKYISRYLRRLPIAEYKISSYDGERVQFWFIDKKTEKRVIQDCSAREFIDLLIGQLPDRYRHGVRYYGLLAPRSKGREFEVFLACLGKRRRPRPRRTPWRTLIWIKYRRDPLRASNGEIMKKVRCWVPGTREVASG